MVCCTRGSGSEIRNMVSSTGATNASGLNLLPNDLNTVAPPLRRVVSHVAVKIQQEWVNYGRQIESGLFMTEIGNVAVCKVK
jgi:hypothetical protein